MNRMYRILHVDDEKMLLDICKCYLEGEGEFIIDIATSAKDVLDTDLSLYDVIISDYLMPGINGISFLKEVRSRFSDIPFILFTGRGHEEVVIEAINNGADFYLQKGGDPEAQFVELKHKIRIAAQRKKIKDDQRKSEEKFHTVADFTYDWEYWYGLDSHIIYISPSCERITGFSPDEFISNPCLLEEISPTSNSLLREMKHFRKKIKIKNERRGKI